MIPNGYHLVIDLSYYNPKTDFEVVSEYVEGFILRIAYGTTKDTCFVDFAKRLYKLGKPIASYQWFRPDQDVKAQLEIARQQLTDAGVPMHVGFSDQEQHGRSGYLNLPPHYSASDLSKRGRDHVEGLTTLIKNVGTYTRSSWISERARPTVWGEDAWLYDYLVWLASWPYASKVVSTTWSDFLANWMVKSFSPYYASGWPNKFADAWQFSGDKFVLPGGDGAFDFNLVSDNMLQLMSTGIQEPEAPAEDSSSVRFEATVLVDNMFRRPKPTKNCTPLQGRFMAGQKFDVLNFAGGDVWAELEPDVWGAVYVDGVQYSEITTVEVPKED